MSPPFSAAATSSGTDPSTGSGPQPTASGCSTGSSSSIAVDIEADLETLSLDWGSPALAESAYASLAADDDFLLGSRADSAMDMLRLGGMTTPMNRCLKAGDADGPPFARAILAGLCGVPALTPVAAFEARLGRLLMVPTQPRACLIHRAHLGLT